MKKVLTVSILLLVSLLSYSQDTNSKQEMSIKALNPTAKIYKLIFMNNTNLGPQNTNTMYVCPLIPINISKKIKMINFAMIPIDTRKSTDGSITETSLGNIQYSAGFMPMKPIKIGGGVFSPSVGPAIQLNSNTYKELHYDTDDSWNVGVSVSGAFKKKGFLGVVSYTPTWGVGGAKQDYTTLQYIMNYSFKSGTGINMSPLLVKNEGFAGDQKWIVPVGIGVSQIVKTKTAIFNFAVSCYYNAVRPVEMADNKLQLQVKFYIMLPSKK
ncbi:hypothetical protein [Flammeovirga kamogawensis]|uniref:Neuromedin U n=1 Tax=Flammeovirga kamogawensis TaxID=373891 RepID=A0ABX8H015_9BACT|nr:hypothetical protein [Flammeovirga kamogawensis]MBB6459451.1 hypothetical protein [Flammeovirga kamogawensis]QWG09004.1 hypothetical protein KM029_08690 [Flammeovirga kamogawensis]TRX67292.1 hypothetical protein EO216_03730 [Flammeovirga kamogawensis]